MKKNNNEDNNMIKLRFILTTSIGFVIGGIIAGMGWLWGSALLGTILEPFKYSSKGYNIELIELLSFSIWGALGGFGLGVAIKKDKMLLILFGAMGFGTGILVSILSSERVFGAGIIVGIIIGFFEGLSIGFYNRNIKSIGILAIFGTVGFGLGGLIGAFADIFILDVVSSMNLGTLTANLIIRTTGFMVMGLIGGAVLGYGEYYLINLSYKEAILGTGNHR